MINSGQKHWLPLLQGAIPAFVTEVGEVRPLAREVYDM
jgi:hypothetical protein